MFLNIGLQKDCCLLRVKSAGKIQRYSILQVFSEFLWVLIHCNAVQIGDKEDYFIFVLILYKVFECSNIVSQCELSGRLDSR